MVVSGAARRWRQFAKLWRHSWASNARACKTRQSTWRLCGNPSSGAIRILSTPWRQQLVWEIWRSCSHAVYELMVVDWFVGLPWFSGANIFKNWSVSGRSKTSVSFQSLYRSSRSWCDGIHLCLASGIVWSVATHPTFLARKGLGAISQAADAGNAGVSVVKPVGLRLKLDTSSPWPWHILNI